MTSLSRRTAIYPESPHPNAESEPEAQSVFPQSPALFILLAIFFTGGLALLMSIVLQGGEKGETHKTGLLAHSPIEFPQIKWNEPLLAELSAPTKPGEEKAIFPVPPPPFSEDIFPCSDCHDGSDVNTKRRELTEEHDNIVLKHGENRWCLDCHDAQNRDKLHLANGDLVDFKESYRLCGQCHGTFYRDWKAGIHGRRRGYWNGPKSYMLCAHCHNPHQPHFQALKPMPPPIRPEFLGKHLLEKEAASTSSEGKLQ